MDSEPPADLKEVIDSEIKYDGFLLAVDENVVAEALCSVQGVAFSLADVIKFPDHSQYLCPLAQIFTSTSIIPMSTTPLFNCEIQFFA